MHLRPEECGVFFDEDEDFAAFTIDLQEIDVHERVFMNKILEGYRLDFNSCTIRIILWGIRVGFYNFPPTSFFTVTAYLKECSSVFLCNGVLIKLYMGMVSVIFFYGVDTIRIRFTTDNGRGVIVQRIFDEC